MAWTKHEQEAAHAVNKGYAVYSEVVDGDQDKTLTIATDLGTKYAIRVTMIEILYVAAAVAVTRTLELVVTRDGVDIYTLLLDSAAHPLTGETVRIHLSPGHSKVSDTSITGATTNHVHHLHPELVLAQGDAMRIRASTGAQGADNLHLFVHAQVLSGI